MPHLRETLNNANAAKRRTDLLGCSNIFVTLSQVLTYNSTSLYTARAGV